MNPIVLSGLYGLGKAALLRSNDHRQDFAQAVITGPIVEEAVYRVGLGALGLRGTVGAFSFAMDHLSDPNATVGETALRFGDTFLGGVLYGQAYAQFGFLGAVAAHVAHNLAVYAVSKNRGPQIPLSAYRRRSRR